MVSLRNIINWNNRGVSLFERRQWDEASEFFLLALEGILECHFDNSNAESEVAWASSFVFRGWSLPPNRIESSGIHLFSRSIVLNHYEGTPPQAILASYAAALRYNKALCLHLSIIHRTEGAIVDDYSPFEVYDEYVLCYNCCFQHSSNSSSPHTSILHTSILFLALVNNMGAILHNDMARFQDASNCLEAAYGALSQIHKKELSVILDDSEINKLSTNLLAVPKTTSPAA
mmetsp:Transcript_22371/g.33816  ORF Transcript_22371/g.33816 Transcript_22371/m.33816 type:complete len:231 (-) Transcript_22371:839-1531(-)